MDLNVKHKSIKFLLKIGGKSSEYRAGQKVIRLDFKKKKQPTIHNREN